MKRYKKYVIGKIQRDRNGKESFMYFEQPIEESEYGMLNNVDMSTLFVIDPVLKTFVFSEKEL
ncbi:MAG: hypothetical protein EBW59_06590 [Betaproteobacteria bacterium]|nr:hypothetical protein [Betaproteobacteria bacterium]